MKKNELIQTKPSPRFIAPTKFRTPFDEISTDFNNFYETMSTGLKISPQVTSQNS